MLGVCAAQRYIWTEPAVLTIVAIHKSIKLLIQPPEKEKEWHINKNKTHNHVSAAAHDFALGSVHHTIII